LYQTRFTDHRKRPQEETTGRDHRKRPQKETTERDYRKRPHKETTERDHRKRPQKETTERDQREQRGPERPEMQLKSSQDAERESEVHLREMEAQLKCIQDSERKAHADLDSERKAHHNALMAMQSVHTLRQEACRDNFQGLLRSERLEHNEHVTKFLASFESIIKDERALHFETQRLLKSESETRMNE
jgi:hypothetical protein